MSTDFNAAQASLEELDLVELSSDGGPILPMFVLTSSQSTLENFLCNEGATAIQIQPPCGAIL